MFRRLPNYLRELIQLIYPHRKDLYLGLTFALIANSFDVFGPYIIKQAFDTLQHQFTWSQLWKWALIMLLLACIRGVFRYFMRMRVVGVSRDCEYDLRNRYFDKLQKLPASFFDRNRTGDLMSRATSDIENVRMMLGPAIMYSANTIVTLVAGLSIMFWLSHELTLLVIGLVPFVAIVVAYLGREEFKRTDASQEKYSELSAAVQDNLTGARVIRAYAQEQREIERMDQHNREYFRLSVRLLRIDGLFQPAMGILFTLGFATILWFGGHLLAAGTITLGTFVAFTTYLGLLSWPMIAIGWVANLIQRGLASWQRIYRILIETDERSNGADVDQIVGHLQFDQVTLQYTPDRRPAIDQISFTLPAGASLGITGKTGSGKSTLAALIPGLYEPTSGTIRLDGKPLTEYSLSSLRKYIGYVPQEAFLFSDTVAANIAYGNTDAPREKIEQMALAASLTNDVDQFQDGFNSLVGERGVTLSGGQKQRTAIARALIMDPRILILDDPLANVDTGTEREVLDSLIQFMQDRTTILIAHRASTVMGCDYVLVLEDGKVAQFGSPKTLANVPGEFAKLIERQRITEELAEVA